MNPSIVFVAPYKRLGELFQEVCDEFGKHYPVIVGELEEGAHCVEVFREKGVDVIISRGGTAIAIRRLLPDIPVVEVPVSSIDLLKAINEAREETDRIILGGFRQFTYGLEELGDLFQFQLKILELEEPSPQQPEQVVSTLLEYRKQGYQMLVGDTTAVGLAEKHAFQTVLIRSGRKALVQAIREAEGVAEIRRRELETSRHLQVLTDYAQEGILFIEPDGRISHFNLKAEKILKVPAHRILGKNVFDLFPEMLSGETLRNGRRALEKHVTILGQSVSLNVIPVEVSKRISRFIVTFTPRLTLDRPKGKTGCEEHNGLTAEYSFEDIIGSCAVMQRVKSEAREYAEVDSPILLYGETGTGKEMFAQAIHNASPRRSRPFVAFNCAALPESLLESELFGYSEGAFTGAVPRGKAGLFELAQGGTIFLDEINEISPNTQVRLLRVLQEKKIRRVGDDKIISIDVRVICASNVDLQSLVEQKRFREDLFYRINVLNLSIPPLRQRVEDIPLLVEFFLKRYNMYFRKNVTGLSLEALQVLQGYVWPGNVRQLENILERLVIKSKDPVISASLTREILNGEPGFKSPSSHQVPSLSIPCGLDLESIERLIIEEMIQRSNGNKQWVADQLGIGRTTLWRKIKSTKSVSKRN